MKKYLKMLLIMCEALDTGTDPIDTAVSPGNIIKMAPNMASKKKRNWVLGQVVCKLGQTTTSLGVLCGERKTTTTCFSPLVFTCRLKVHITDKITGQF